MSSNSATEAPRGPNVDPGEEWWVAHKTQSGGSLDPVESAPCSQERCVKRAHERNYHFQCEGCYHYFCSAHLSPHLEIPCEAERDVMHGRAREPWYRYDPAGVIAEKTHAPDSRFRKRKHYR